MDEKKAWIESILQEPVYESSEARASYIKKHFFEKMLYWNAPITETQIEACRNAINTFQQSNRITDAHFRNFLELFNMEQLHFAGL